MERLTSKAYNGAVPVKFDLDFVLDMPQRDWRGLQEIFDRLAAYEESGLEPEEIERILDSYGRGMTLRTENAQRLEIIKEIPINRLRELAQAYREGRVKIDPKALKCPKCGKMRLFPRIDWQYYYCYSCKTQFPREAAEVALEAQRGENNA